MRAAATCSAARHPTLQVGRAARGPSSRACRSVCGMCTPLVGLVPAAAAAAPRGMRCGRAIGPTADAIIGRG